MADGPISTPRRLAPRSMGTPISWTVPVHGLTAARAGAVKVAFMC